MNSKNRSSNQKITEMHKFQQSEPFFNVETILKIEYGQTVQIISNEINKSNENINISYRLMKNAMIKP